MKYRKKSVVIEAVQLRWDTWDEMCTHAGVGRLENGAPEGRLDGETMLLDVPTLNGVVTATQGEWIIRGVKGELYPCASDIFEATYEQVLE